MSNNSQNLDDSQGMKELTSESDCNPLKAGSIISDCALSCVYSPNLKAVNQEGSEDRRDKRKEAKKFLFKKESKDKGYLSLSTENNQDSIFLVNTK
jgi:hypothetical protein